MSKGYPYDLRWAGPNSRVKVIHPDGRVTYEPDICFYAISLKELNYRQLLHDLYLAKKGDKITT